MKDKYKTKADLIKELDYLRHLLAEREKTKIQLKREEEALRESEGRYRALASTEDSMYLIDREGRYRFMNNAHLLRLGLSLDKVIGRSYDEFHSEEDTRRFTDEVEAVFATGNSFQSEHRSERDNKYFLRTFSPVKDLQGEIINVTVISKDITKHRRAEEALRHSEEKYRTILDSNQEGYFEVDLAGNFTFVNDAECSLLGYNREELIGLSYKRFTEETAAKKLFKLFNRVYRTGERLKAFEAEFIKKNGTKGFNEISVSTINNKEGQPIGFRGLSRDITERKRSEERIQYLATHDALTDLPNRMMFTQMLNHAVQSARRFIRQLAVIFIDLDRFKVINDTLGHEEGDQLLQEVAKRLKKILREIDIVARLGGDEFVVLIEEVSKPDQVATVAQKILSAIIKPVVLRGQEYQITASIGISMYPKDGHDEQSLMKSADIAMYMAKEEGKNNYQFYTADIKSRSLERLKLETNLRKALERNEFLLYYQAKLEFKTGAISGVEALLRWQNPDLGLVFPSRFIPVAEETGLIVPIGRWVLKTACAQNVAWQNQGLPKVCVAVNLSIRQFMDDSLLKDVHSTIKETGLAPNLLELEITESMLMQNPERMIKILTKIKNLGVRLAIDDFGTGYSSLAQIRQFPIDTIKVDQSFIHDLSKNPEDRAIIEAIIPMGKALSLAVLAEGVETEEQEAFLREQACDQMQGYYFSKPVTPDQFAELLGKHVPISPQLGNSSWGHQIPSAP